jgi:hypothetical protein
MFKYIGLAILAWAVLIGLLFWICGVLFDYMPGDMMMAL